MADARRTTHWDTLIAAATVNTFVIDAATDFLAGVFRAHRAGTISHVHVPLLSVTGAPALTIRAETCTNNVPSGTLFGTGTSAAWSPGGSDTAQWRALDTGAVVAAGDYIAAVIGASSADGSNLADFLMSAGTGGLFPLALSKTGASYTIGSGTRPCVAMRYTEGDVLEGAVPIAGHTATTDLGDATTPDEVGTTWTAPVACECDGGFVFCRYNNTAANLVLRLYSGTTLLASAQVDGTRVRAAFQTGWVPVRFSSAVALQAGQQYSLVVTTTTNSVRLIEVTFADSAARLSCFGIGHRIHRTDAGAWSENTLAAVTVIPSISALSGGGSRILSSMVIG